MALAATMKRMSGGFPAADQVCDVFRDLVDWLAQCQAYTLTVLYRRQHRKRFDNRRENKSLQNA